VEVEVERRVYKGPIDVRLEGLPKNVTESPVRILADQNRASIRLSAAPSAAGVEREVRVLATGGGLTAEQGFKLTVRKPPASQPFQATMNGLGGVALLNASTFPGHWHKEGLLARMTGKGEIVFPRQDVRSYVCELEVEMTEKSDLYFFWGDVSGVGLQMHLWWREGHQQVDFQLESNYGQGKALWQGQQPYSHGQRLYFRVLVDDDRTAMLYQDGQHLRTLSKAEMKSVPLQLRIRSVSDQTDSAIHRCSFRPLTDPEVVASLTMAANSDYQKKNYRAAITAGTEIVRLSPKNADAHNQLAWRLATCLDASVRDGPKAVTYARKACELTGWENANILDTLAAAYAEAGQFDEAETWQTKAFLLAGEAQKLRYGARLKSYRARKPYHE
jgi:hypothetical protein